MKPLWLKLMDEQSEEAAPKHVLLQQQQLAVCKQVGWRKKWRKTENLKTFHSLQPLTTYHYLHFSFTIIKFFLYFLWEEEEVIMMFFA